MSRSLPPLNALRVFEVAARRLSFRQAADELHVTPAAISRAISTNIWSYAFEYSTDSTTLWFRTVTGFRSVPTVRLALT
jgi:LysR family glycine cleavage system transcriptional activator